LYAQIYLLSMSLIVCPFIVPTFCVYLCFFFFNATATTEIYTLSLHDALPISCRARSTPSALPTRRGPRSSRTCSRPRDDPVRSRSEEHTSELQSRENLVCRLLLEKKKKIASVRYSMHIHYDI